ILANFRRRTDRCRNRFRAGGVFRFARDCGANRIGSPRHAIELDPLSAEAMEYLDLLYRQKAERVANVTERDQLLKIAVRSRQEARQIRDRRAGRASRPDDQFSRPAPPPPPS